MATDDVQAESHGVLFSGSDRLPHVVGLEDIAGAIVLEEFAIVDEEGHVDSLEVEGHEVRASVEGGDGVVVGGVHSGAGRVDAREMEGVELDDLQWVFLVEGLDLLLIERTDVEDRPGLAELDRDAEHGRDGNQGNRFFHLRFLVLQDLLVQVVWLLRLEVLNMKEAQDQVQLWGSAGSCTSPCSTPR